MSQTLCKQTGGRKAPKAPALAPMKTRGLSSLLRVSHIRLWEQQEANRDWETFQSHFLGAQHKLHVLQVFITGFLAPFFDTSHWQTEPRSSAALLQDLSCWTTSRAHKNKGFASKSTGLDTKLCQPDSRTEPVPT